MFESPKLNDGLTRWYDSIKAAAEMVSEQISLAGRLNFETKNTKIQTAQMEERLMLDVPNYRIISSKLDSYKYHKKLADDALFNRPSIQEESPLMVMYRGVRDHPSGGVVAERYCLLRPVASGRSHDVWKAFDLLRGCIMSLWICKDEGVRIEEPSGREHCEHKRQQKGVCLPLYSIEDVHMSGSNRMAWICEWADGVPLEEYSLPLSSVSLECMIHALKSIIESVIDGGKLHKGTDWDKIITEKRVILLGGCPWNPLLVVGPPTLSDQSRHLSKDGILNMIDERMIEWVKGIESRSRMFPLRTGGQ
eukprot:GHVO01042891.1.p1 GENE.GHVO01042891.1~~GHVO01042891.1.p1  ORF type:complete len:307 (+),score=41.03 GHVO01042891.1:721-1641(+)